MEGLAADPSQAGGVAAVEVKGNFMFDPATHRDFLGAWPCQLCALLLASGLLSAATARQGLKGGSSGAASARLPLLLLTAACCPAVRRLGSRQARVWARAWSAAGWATLS